MTRTGTRLFMVAVFVVSILCLSRFDFAAAPAPAQGGAPQFEYARLRCSIRSDAAGTAVTAKYSWWSPRATIGGDRHELIEEDSPDAVAKRLKTIKSANLDLMDLMNLLGSQGWSMVQRRRERESLEDVETFLFARRL